MLTLATASAMTLAACGGGADDEAAARATVTVEHELGRSAIPVDPRRLVAVDELAGLAALSVGRTPSVVFASTGDAAAGVILEDAGVEVREAGLGELPDLEELAEISPDLIVGTGAQAAIGTEYATVERLAPTVVLGIEGSWRDLVAANAAAFGRKDVGRRQVETISVLLESAEEASDGESLSLLGHSTEAFSMPPHSPSSTLVAEAGFVRPTWQQQTTDSYSLPLPDERLDDQDADVLVVPDGQYYPAGGLEENPLYDQLDGDVVNPVAEAWFDTTPFAFYVIAHDLEQIATGGEVLTADDLPEQWTQFLEEVDG